MGDLFDRLDSILVVLGSIFGEFGWFLDNIELCRSISVIIDQYWWFFGQFHSILVILWAILSNFSDVFVQFCSILVNFGQFWWFLVNFGDFMGNFGQYFGIWLKLNTKSGQNIINFNWIKFLIQELCWRNQQLQSRVIKLANFG